MYVVIAVIVVLLIAFIWFQVPVESMAPIKARTVELHYAVWCPSCRIMRPVWDAVRKSAPAAPSVVFTENDEDKSPTPGINYIPTILMIDENGITHKYNGQTNYEQLRDWIYSPLPPNW